jgi:DNA-directed RNA polymerase beta' subunit
MLKGEEYVIYTSGVNLKEIRNIVGIDIYKTFSDNVQEMFATFGIEVGRNRLMNEFIKAYKNSGNSVNPQHVAVLVDIMCYNGIVISADRHGMKKSNIDPLSKASFEKTIDVLMSAAVFGDSDRMNGISSRIMAGQVIKGGTGYCEVGLDIDMIQNSEYIDKPIFEKGGLATSTIANSIIRNKHKEEEEEEEEEGEDIFIPS